jgi:phosphatidylglycerol:prolipoprotein diacylglycerol transferase
LHPSFFQLGHLHIPIFGVVAAIGLMAALAFSQITARYADLDGAALWDAGLTGMIAVFVISRVLLVVFNLHSFLMYPVLLLAVPSLTSTGVLLTAAFLVVYLRRKRLPLLAVLDASAPCAASAASIPSSSTPSSSPSRSVPPCFRCCAGGTTLEERRLLAC